MDDQGQSPAEREADLAMTFVRLAEMVTTSGDELEMLELVAHSCARILDGDAAGVSLGSGGTLGFVVATSEEMDLVELFQAQRQEGPCMEAYGSGRPVSVSDLETGAETWPNWRARALRLGFRAAVAFPMRHHGHTIGVIDLYATRPRTLNDRDLLLGELLAQMATIVVTDRRQHADLRTLNRQLNDALDSRVVIEQAKGVLAERNGIAPHDAFELLRRHARRHSTKLRSVADQVVNDDLDPARLDSAEAPSTETPSIERRTPRSA